MPNRILSASLVAAVLCVPHVLAQGPAATQVPAEPRAYFTEPAIAPDRSEIAFASGGDLWTVPIAGGDARLVHLPEIGILGGTHFLMSDLNNVEIADEVSKFLVEKKLD